MEGALLSAPALLLAFLLILSSALWRWWKPPTPPQPAGSWPIIGHLCLLRGPELPHITFSKLADKYGPIFMVKLGVNRVLVVSNRDMAKECLADNDKVFLNRPRTLAVEYMAYNAAMVGFSPYGPYWREIRKLITLELLSTQRLHMLKSARVSEVRLAMKSLHQKLSNSKTDMKQWFWDINLSAMVRLVAGKSSRDFKEDEYDRYQKAIREFFDLFGTVVVSDALPFLTWWDVGGYKKAMKETARELDQVVQGWLDEHKRQRGGMPVERSKDKKDFMDVMLDVYDTAAHDDQKDSSFQADTVIKATCLAMILGGTDSNIATLTWALSLLLNHPRELKKVQDEIDAHVGKERLVEESDLKNLTYLQAVVKEALRLYPPLPLSAPREAIADCKISGYHVPAGTRLFVNLHKIHRDPELWSDPYKFYPERFLTSHGDVDVKGQNFELIPFGSGRRVCPGISFALQMVQFTLASLVQGFEISTPSGQPVDMTESFGLNNVKATPLDVVLTPRLQDHLYSGNYSS